MSDTKVVNEFEDIFKKIKGKVLQEIWKIKNIPQDKKSVVNFCLDFETKIGETLKKSFLEVIEIHLKYRKEVV